MLISRPLFSPQAVRSKRFILTPVGVILAISLGSCGYHVAGKADMLPDTLEAIYVRPFANVTSEYKIEQHLTQAVAQEFTSRTRYTVVHDESQADATLTGTVVNVFVLPMIFDRTSNRATTIQTVTQVNVALWDRRSGELLYENPNLELRERYEVSTDAEAYFEERQQALIRTSDEMARNLVSAILEQF